MSKCEHPASALLALSDEYVWCSRCGSLGAYNEVYELTWRPPSVDLHAFVFDLADDDCSYRDDCPSSARHYRCLRCKARHELGIT